MTTPTPCTAVCNWRRIGLGCVLALALGFGFAAVSGYVIGDFATSVAAAENPASDTYLVSLKNEEDMLRSLSEQLMQGSAADPAALSDIAPAAGAPLGTLE